MGFNADLGMVQYVPGMYPFQKDVQPPIAPPTPPESSVALQAAQAKLTTLKAKAASSQAALTAAKTKLSLAQAQASTTKAQAQQAYAAAVAKQNAQNQASVDAYNPALKQNLPAVAAAYNKAVAAENIKMSIQATKTTQLLHYNVAQAYAAAKQTYTPMSTTLPSSKPPST